MRRRFEECLISATTDPDERRGHWRARLRELIAEANAVGAAVSDELLLVTVRRLYYVALIAMPVNVAHLLIFWPVATPTVQEQRWRLGILGAHAALLLVMALVALASARLRRRPVPGRAGRVLCWASLLTVLLAGASIAVVDQWVTTSILPFLIACLIVGLIFLVRPQRVVFAYLGAYALFAGTLGLTQDDPSVLVSNQVNAITSVALGFCLSFLLWRSEARNVLQQRQITEQQRELADRNRELAHLAAVDTSSGDVRRHRLSRRGNRQMNKVLHTAAKTQLRRGGPGRTYHNGRCGTLAPTAA